MQQLRLSTRGRPIHWIPPLAIMSFYLIAALSATMLISQSSAFVPVAIRNAQTMRISQGNPLFVAKSGGRMIGTVEEFEQIVLAEESSRPVLAFFSAAWCGPCRLSVPVVKDIMKQFSGKIDVVEICTDDLPETSADCGVVSIPTIQLYYRGELLDTIVGCVARNVLASAVTKVLEDVSVDSDTEDSKRSLKEDEA